jgi:prolyl-tRNA editing enzyme YbaK/EbsC (Cys-tRNA(Pro) deacylase)
MNELNLLPIVKTTLDEHAIDYSVLACIPELADTAAFCEHYNVSLDQAANTIVVMSRKAEPALYAVCVVLGTTRLDVNKKVCQLLGVKKASFADGDITTSLTGMMIGGVTAIGIKGLPVYIDSAVLRQTEVVMGGGNRSSKLLLNPQELTKLPDSQIVDGLATPRE